MPLKSDLVGLRSDPYHSTLDDRWAMNYAAGINDSNPVLYDTREAILPVHPLYLSHPEWEAWKTLMPRLSLTDEELSMSVQVSQDTVLHQPLRSRQNLATVASISGVERHRAGALITAELETRDEAGEKLATTTIQSVLRTVDVLGDDKPHHGEEAQTFTLDGDVSTSEISISPMACHLYSECARIWNPFHTDIKVAEGVGISGLILHGTATVAMAVSEVCRLTEGMAIDTISRISAGLKAMVFAPSRTELRYGRPAPNADGTSTVSFELHTEDGGRALTQGLITFDPTAVGSRTKEGAR